MPVSLKTVMDSVRIPRMAPEDVGGGQMPGFSSSPAGAWNENRGDGFIMRPRAFAEGKPKAAPPPPPPPSRATPPPAAPAAEEPKPKVVARPAPAPGEDRFPIRPDRKALGQVDGNYAAARQRLADVKEGVAKGMWGPANSSEAQRAIATARADAEKWRLRAFEARRDPLLTEQSEVADSLGRLEKNATIRIANAKVSLRACGELGDEDAQNRCREEKRRVLHGLETHYKRQKAALVARSEEANEVVEARLRDETLSEWDRVNDVPLVDDLPLEGELPGRRKGNSGATQERGRKAPTDDIGESSPYRGEDSPGTPGRNDSAGDNRTGDDIE